MSPELSTPVTARTRWIILLVITGVVLAGAGIYAVSAFQRFQQGQLAGSSVKVASGDTALPVEPFVLFRNTAAGQGYGKAATVPLDDVQGARSVSGVACDRVYGNHQSMVCLRTNRGLVTSFEAAVYNADYQQGSSEAVPGVPSRARIDPTGTMMSSTVFVTGHSYAGSGFSTETVIRPLAGGDSPGNLEKFTFIVNGETVTATDRNMWGVTFVPGDPDSFYATTSSSGRLWLVRGSISARTLTAVHDGVECPSISPDGTRIGFKKNTGTQVAPHWKIAVLDLGSGVETVLAETASVDDQVEWLDNNFLLYGLPRADQPGDSDIWKIPAVQDSAPELFIEHAWSPSVVH